MRTPDALARARFEEWEELEDLVDRQRLRRHEVERLGSLYRRVVSDLAAARRDFPADRVTRHLESLAARAHPRVFRGRAPVVQDLSRLLAVEFPAAVRSLWPEVVVAGVALFGTLGIVLVLTLAAPSRMEPFVDPALLRDIRDVGARAAEEGTAPWTEAPSRPALSFLVATNNVQVALVAFAGGATLGLLTLHVLVLNGVMLGLVTGFSVLHGAAGSLGGFVLAHGFLELSVIVLAGASGLSIGRALLAPRDRPRGVAVTAAARSAVTVALGGALALLVAALLEGFLSPSAASPWLKLGAGLAAATLFWWFIVGAPPARAAAPARRSVSHALRV